MNFSACELFILPPYILKDVEKFARCNKLSKLLFQSYVHTINIRFIFIILVTLEKLNRLVDIYQPVRSGRIWHKVNF